MGNPWSNEIKIFCMERNKQKEHDQECAKKFLCVFQLCILASVISHLKKYICTLNNFLILHFNLVCLNFQVANNPEMLEMYIMKSLCSYRFKYYVSKEVGG